MALTIEQMNAMDFDVFVETFSNIMEHCAIITGALWTRRPFVSLSHVLDEIKNIVSQLPKSVRSGILRVHPDLAGRLADEGRLTMESQREQAKAGLGDMSGEERMMMKQLNKRYRDKFGFPFVICARENKKDAILKGIHRRLQNTQDQEVEAGLQEVMSICRLRLADLVKDSQSKL